MASLPEPMIREYYRGPLLHREHCYDVWFPLFGEKMVSATVILDVPWFVENPHHSMMLTDIEWQEWIKEAKRHVRDYRAKHADVRMLGEVPL